MAKTLIKTKEVRGIMTKSNLPVGGYSVNPYVGCTHACKYCYASFMKRFTGHKEEWGTFLDVKHWPAIENPKKYAGQRVVIGSVTDGYNPEEATFRRTRKLLEELKDSDAEILICTKSDLVLRDLDLLRQMKKVTVSWSINTLDETFRADMDKAVSIERRIAAMRKFYEAGIRTICFVSPWLENLNLRGGFKANIMDYIKSHYPHLFPLYEEIYLHKDRTYWKQLEQEAAKMAQEAQCKYVDNELPYERSPKGHPSIVNYLYHEEIRGSGNTGKRNVIQ